MSRVLGGALVLVLLAPAALAATPAPDYPAELRTLYSGWLDEMEALVTAEDRAKPWFPQADLFLQMAVAAEEAGRVREGMFHLETFHEILQSKRLMDEAASLSNDADRRLFTIQKLRSVNADGDAAWSAYRAKLDGYDGELRSLKTMELALYSGDVAVNAVFGGGTFEPLATDFAKQREYPEGYVLALVRASHTVVVALGWANDILDLATRGEGLPPKIVDEGWRNVTALAMTPPYDTPPPNLEALETFAKPVRENNEQTLAIVFFLETQRLSRVSSMQTIFGDASARGKDVLSDASRFMAAQANNTTLDVPRGYGLAGVFTSDALDRVALTQRYVANGTAEVDLVYHSWASLDYATYATGALSRMSPITPPATPSETPAIGILALLSIAAVIAIATRRR